MAWKIVVFLVFFCAVAVIEASGHPNVNSPFFRYTSKNVAAKRDSVPTPIPEFQNFTQYRDHFNTQDKTTFQQRYVINSEFWDGTGPVFLMFGPEYDLNPAVVVEQGGYIFVQWAKHFKALLVGIETRYYGRSFPVPDYTAENLKYLTDAQILADTALFREYIAERHNAHHNKWITFGGSYSGALSGWMRLKYPNLIYASVSSSGIVFHEDGNPQYMEVVIHVLKTMGSQQCVDNIASAVRQLENLTSTEEGRAYLSEYFNTCDPMQPQDVTNFFALIAGQFQGVAQLYGVIPFVTPAQACAVMTNQSNSPLTNLRNLVVEKFLEGRCGFISVDQYNAIYNNTDREFAAQSGRQYVYQLCYELGGLAQTTETTSYVFGPAGPLENFHNKCITRYGMTPSQANYDWTNIQYGGKHPGGSRILWVNGNIDPWHRVSITHTPPGAEWDTLFIHGTSHCADMFVPDSYSPPQLVPAQAVIKHTLGNWIREQ